MGTVKGGTPAEFDPGSGYKGPTDLSGFFRRSRCKSVRVQSHYIILEESSFEGTSFFRVPSYFVGGMGVELWWNWELGCEVVGDWVVGLR